MRSLAPDGALDRQLEEEFGLVAGLDEVGRGALAGPVTVAAVILDPARPIPGLDDSKRLTPRKRESLARSIKEQAIAWVIVDRPASEIDRINILEATRAAMTEAVGRLVPRPTMVVTDAVPLPAAVVEARAERGADRRFCCVAAASIIAKVARDAQMVLLAQSFPGYRWEHNKGYPSPAHLAALRRLGPCPLHRRSFAPVRVLA